VSEKAKYLGQIVSFDDRDVEINERKPRSEGEIKN
jgi:hypothetical protein